MIDSIHQSLIGDNNVIRHAKTLTTTMGPRVGCNKYRLTAVVEPLQGIRQ